MTARGSRAVVLALGLAALVAMLFVIACARSAAATSEPPLLGRGDWTVTDRTVMVDRFIMLWGNLTVEPGGDLELRNSTVLFACSRNSEFGLAVRPGGALRVLDGSTLGSSRAGLHWTAYAEAGSVLRLVDSSVIWCGSPKGSENEDPRWYSLCVETSDAVIEGSSISWGNTGLHFAPATRAYPVRNCTFESDGCGIETSMTDVEGCTFQGTECYQGIKVFGRTDGSPTRIVGCTFRLLFSTGVWAESGGPASITDCTFESCPKGVWDISGQPFTVSGCTFKGMTNAAIDVGNLASVRIVDGTFRDCPHPVLSAPKSSVNWDVMGDAVIEGGALTLSGNLTLAPGAHLRLLECANLTMLGTRPNQPRVALGDDALLELVNTTLLRMSVPEWSFDGPPILLYGPNATLELDGVARLDLDSPAVVGELVARRSGLRLGAWEVGTLHLEECTLGRDPLGHDATIVILGKGGVAGEVVRVRLTGIPTGGPGAPPWLDVRGGALTSEDFLHDLGSMLAGGELRLPSDPGVASIEARWSVVVDVRWQNGVPVGGAIASATDVLGATVTVSAAADGRAILGPLTAEVAASATDVQLRYPYGIEALVPGGAGRATLQVLASVVEVPIMVVDTVPPVLDVDQGSIVGTRVPNVTITGTARDGESGIAYMEAGVLPRGYVRVPLPGPDGRFALDVEALARTEVLSIRLYDQSGNRDERKVVIFFSTEPPRIFSIEPAPGTVVNTTMLTVWGESEPNVTVEAMGRLATTTDNGSFRLVLQLLEGRNAFEVNFTDLAGNRNATSMRVTLDSVAPRLAITSPVSAVVTRETRWTIEGVTDVGCTIYINSAEVVPDGTGTFMARVGLSEGAQTIVVRAVDGAGNAVAVGLVFTVDTVAPSLSVLWPPEGALSMNSTTIDVRLQVDPAATLTLDGMPLSTGNGTVQARVTLAEGENTIVLRAVDAMGNEAVVRRTVRVDSMPPLLEWDPTPPSLTASTVLRLSGRTEPGMSLTLNGAPVPLGAAGSFSTSVQLMEGPNHLVLVSVDGSGNSARIEWDVELVPPAPTLKERTSSLLPALLAATALVLSVEGIALGLWRVRARRRRPRGG